MAASSWHLLLDLRFEARRCLVQPGRFNAGGTYRAVYTVKFAEAVFVLHCFQKKSKRGIATPKEDMDIVHARLKIAEAYVKELRK